MTSRFCRPSTSWGHADCPDLFDMVTFTILSITILLMMKSVLALFVTRSCLSLPASRSALPLAYRARQFHFQSHGLSQKLVSTNIFNAAMTSAEEEDLAHNGPSTASSSDDVNQGKEVTTVESSLRLDAVASAGLGISRSQFTKLLNSRCVFIGDTAAKNAAVTVKAGQVVRVSGQGQVKVVSIKMTHSGKYQVTCKRIKTPYQV
eukprot:gene10776-11977_t